MQRIILFGDEHGFEIMHNALRNYHVAGIVYSAKRLAAKAKAEYYSSVHQCPVLCHPRPSDKNESKDFLDRVSLLNPTLGLCYSYDMILQEELLKLFKDNIYNIHGGLLPAYRGANILNWVVINGESHTGVTLHRMIKEVDAGPIILQKTIAIDFLDTAVTLREKIGIEASLILEQGMAIIDSASFIQGIPQLSHESKVWPRRKPEDGFIDWHWPTTKIYNLIRALVYPWPGAWFIRRGEKIVLRDFVSFDEVGRMQKEIIGYVNP